MPTGPLFGDQRGQLQPQGLILDIEQNVLSLLTPDAQVQLEKLQESGRRPMIVRPRNMLCQSFDNGIELKFWLPKGAYATECVRYFIASLSERVVKQNVKA